MSGAEKVSSEAEAVPVPSATETKDNGAAATTSAETNGDVKMNGGGELKPAAAAVKPEPSEDGDEEMDDGDKASEGAEEEEALFVKMEEDEEKEEAAHPHDQPTDVKAAPKLLQTALEKGEVEPDDSEKEEDKKVEEQKAAGPPSPDHHYHARVSFSFFSLFAPNSDAIMMSFSRRQCLIFCCKSLEIGQTIGFLAFQGIGILQLYFQRLGRAPVRHDGKCSQKGGTCRKAIQETQGYRQGIIGSKKEVQKEQW